MLNSQGASEGHWGPLSIFVMSTVHYLLPLLMQTLSCIVSARKMKWQVELEKRLVDSPACPSGCPYIHRHHLASWTLSCGSNPTAYRVVTKISKRSVPVNQNLDWYMLSDFCTLKITQSWEVTLSTSLQVSSPQSVIFSSQCPWNMKREDLEALLPSLKN